VIDLGLLGGWTAGGPATDPGVPAVDFEPATGVSDETGVAALDAAFRNLIDALAPAVDPSLLDGAGDVRTTVDSADSAEPPAGIAPEVIPVFWPAPAAALAALSFFLPADRPGHPHAVVADEEETHAAVKPERDDSAATNIVVGMPAPIVAAEAPADPRVSNSTLIADRPAEDIDARPNTNQKAVPAYQAQVHSAAIAAGVHDVIAASPARPVPIELSEEPVETKEATAMVARLHAPAPSAATPATAEQFDPNSQRDRSEGRRAGFTLTFSKPLGHDVRAAAESIASAKPGSAPHSILTFTLPVPEVPTASPVTARATAVTFSPELPASRETADQIVQAIRLTLARGGGEAHIRLDPRQFGDLTIALKVDRGEVVARLQAETSEVRDWLRANQHLLREGLAQHDLRLDRLEIAASSEERQDARDAEDERQGRHRDDGGRPAPRKARARETSAIFDIVA